MTPRPPTRLNVLVTLFVLVAFYGTLLAIAGGVAWMGYASFTHRLSYDLRLVLMGVFLPGFLLWPILPRVRLDLPPGPRLEASSQPRLFAELESVARAAGQPLPAEVYLCPELNAFVGRRGGTLAFGGRRILGIGLPLLALLTRAELRAVLGHEFGHFHGGDLSVVPWLLEVRAGLGRLLEQAERSGRPPSRFFLWYALALLRLTHRVSRAQELAADRLAARIVGPTIVASALRKIEGGDAVFGPFVEEHLVPAMIAGYRPSLVAGCARFLGARTVAQATEAVLVVERKLGKRKDYLDHPPLEERLSAIEGEQRLEREAGGVAPEGDDPAVELLEGLPALELGVLEQLFEGVDVQSLQPAPWENLSGIAQFEGWRQTVRVCLQQFGGRTPASLIEWALDPVRIARSLNYPRLRADQAITAAAGPIGAALALGLVENGWVMEGGSGDGVRLRTGEHVLEPFSVFPALATGDMTPEFWMSFCERARISTLDLGRLGKDRPWVSPEAAARALAGPTPDKLPMCLWREAHAAIHARRARTVVRRTALLWIPVAVLGLLLGGMGLDHWVGVVVDNPSTAPLSLEVDGSPWVTVAPGEHVWTRLARGSHRIAGTASADLPAVAEFDVTVDPDRWESLCGSGVYLCDPLRRGAYVYRELAYGRNRQVQFQSSVWRCWTWFPRVDFVLEPAPKSTSSFAGDSGRRWALERVASTAAEPIPLGLLALLPPAEVIETTQLALERGLFRPGLCALLRSAAESAGRQEEILAWVGRKRSTDPRTTAFHRLYQDWGRAQGGYDALCAEYADFRRQHPQLAMAHYLWSRLLEDAEPALAAAREAIRLEPSDPWAHRAARYHLRALGRWEEAVLESEAASRLSTEPGGEPWLGWQALAEAHRWAELDAGLEPVFAVKGAPESEPALLTWVRVAIWSDGESDEFERRLTHAVRVSRTRTGESGLPVGWPEARRLERAVWGAHVEEAERFCIALEGLGADAPMAAERAASARWALELARAVGEAASSASQAATARPSGGGSSAVRALLQGVADEWAGMPEVARAEYAEVACAGRGGGGPREGGAAEGGELRDDASRLARLLVTGAGVQELRALPIRSDTPLHIVRLLACARRAPDRGERARWLQEATRGSLWEMGEAGLAIRVFFLTQPAAAAGEGGKSLPVQPPK
ncbi:MAG: M48 family metalloprotease [Planctomycetes bacterium]|nr:M48 family metalloprotease [Planctomycetota bacterium]